MPTSRLKLSVRSDIDSLSDSQVQLIQSVDSVKNRNIFVRHLCAVRTLILLLSLALALGMFVVIVLVAVSNIWSLVQLSRKTQDVTLDVLKTYIVERLKEPQMFSMAALSPYTTNLIGNDPGDFDRQVARRYVFNSHYRAKNVISGSKLTFVVTSMEGGEFSVMGIDGGSSDFYSILFEDWGNLTTPGYFMDVYFVVGDSPNNIPPQPFAQSPDFKSTWIFSQPNPKRANWDGIFTTDECTETPQGKVCPISDSFASRKIEQGKIVTAANVIIRSEALQPSLTEFVTLIPGSVAFILEKSSQITFCTSDPAVPVLDPNQFPTKMLKGYELNNTLMAAASIELYNRYGDKFEKLGTEKGQVENEIFTYRLNGKTRFCGVSYISDEFGMNFIVVLTGSNEDLIGGAITFVSTTVVISVLIGIVSIFIGITAAVIIAMSLSKIVGQIKYLKNMELELVTQYPTSIFTEVAAIQGSFYTAVDRLRDYKAYLPAYVLERDYGIAVKQQPEEIKPVQKTAQLDIQTAEEVSRKSSTQSRRSSVSSSIPPVPENRKFALGLEPGLGAILVVELHIPHSLYSLNDTIQVFSQLFQTIQNAVAVEKGLIVRYDQGNFLIYWDYNDKLASRVVRCAMTISECLSKLPKNVTLDVREMKVFVSAVVGPCMQGSIGTKTKRQYVVFGVACDRAESLLQVAQEWDAPVLISDQLMTKSVKDTYATRPLATFAFGSEKVKAMQITAKSKIESDEWMYEMLQQSNLNKYECYTEAMDHLQHNDLQEGLSLMKKQLETTPEDRATLKMISILQEAQLSGLNTSDIQLSKEFEFVYAPSNRRDME